MTFVYRGNSHQRKSAACPKFDMVWLHLWPIPVGRKGVISSFKWFLPALLHIEKGERGWAHLWATPLWSLWRHYPKLCYLYRYLIFNTHYLYIKNAFSVVFSRLRRGLWSNIWLDEQRVESGPESCPCGKTSGRCSHTPHQAASTAPGFKQKWTQWFLLLWWIMKINANLDGIPELWMDTKKKFGEIQKNLNLYWFFLRCPFDGQLQLLFFPVAKVKSYKAKHTSITRVGDLWHFGVELDPLTNGSGSDFRFKSFLQWLQVCKKKYLFSTIFF